MIHLGDTTESNNVKISYTDAPWCIRIEEENISYKIIKNKNVNNGKKNEKN